MHKNLVGDHRFLSNSQAFISNAPASASSVLNPTSLRAFSKRDTCVRVNPACSARSICFQPLSCRSRLSLRPKRTQMSFAMHQASAYPSEHMCSIEHIENLGHSLLHNLSGVCAQCAIFVGGIVLCGIFVCPGSHGPSTNQLHDRASHGVSVPPRAAQSCECA